jgi:hypothetical protein
LAPVITTVVGVRKFVPGVFSVMPVTTPEVLITAVAVAPLPPPRNVTVGAAVKPVPPEVRTRPPSAPIVEPPLDATAVRPLTFRLPKMTPQGFANEFVVLVPATAVRLPLLLPRIVRLRAE